MKQWKAPADGTVEQGARTVSTITATDETACYPVGTFYAGRYAAVFNLAGWITCPSAVTHESCHVVATLDLAGYMQVSDGKVRGIFEQTNRGS